MARVGLSLGSNLGDRLAHLQEAVRRLKPVRSSPHLLASGLYETEPLDCREGDPGFYNVAIEIETGLPPGELLQHTQQIEKDLGRPSQRAVNSPRVIDLDLLYYDDLILETAALTLPHPRMLMRAFVLIPLSEFRPEYVGKATEVEAVSVVRLNRSWLPPEGRGGDPGTTTG